MSSLYGVGVWPAACNRLLHGRRSHAENASRDAIRNRPSADCRRPEARSGRPTDAVKGQRFGEGSSHASSPRVASSGDRTIRCCPNGHELYARYRRRWRRAGTCVTDSFHGQLLPVVVMTAWSSVDLAVEAMRRGASDFIPKPWEHQDILKKWENQL